MLTLKQTGLALIVAITLASCNTKIRHDVTKEAIAIAETNVGDCIAPLTCEERTVWLEQLGGNENDLPTIPTILRYIEENRFKMLEYQGPNRTSIYQKLF